MKSRKAQRDADNERMATNARHASKRAGHLRTLAKAAQARAAALEQRQKR